VSEQSHGDVPRRIASRMPRPPLPAKRAETDMNRLVIIKEAH